MQAPAIELEKGWATFLTYRQRISPSAPAPRWSPETESDTRRHAAWPRKPQAVRPLQPSTMHDEKLKYRLKAHRGCRSPADWAGNHEDLRTRARAPNPVHRPC